MGKRKYENASGEMVTFDELDEAEQAYYSPRVQKDVQLTGISVAEFAKNFWRDNAVDWDADDDDAK